MEPYKHQTTLADFPDPVTDLLSSFAIPPHLLAHLILVHDVALQLLDGLDRLWPSLGVDVKSVRFGAATHDIGKIIQQDELTGPGHNHERAGEQLLLQHGAPARHARFARTHALWQEAADVELEDLLVALADAVWNGKRDKALEAEITQQIAARTGQATWEVFMNLDDLLTALASDADRRLLWQTQFLPDDVRPNVGPD
jgi:putative nucleotidyltransferase with HDIG domain